MARKSILMVVAIVLVFTLACNFVTKPFRDAQQAVGTAQSVATQINEFTTLVPIETLSALPTVFSEFGNYFDPQGTPVAEWNGIPIMSQATAGQEFDANNYSFKFSGTVKEAVDFYGDALGKAGWSPVVTIPGDEQFATLSYQKDNSFLTVTISNTDSAGAIVVWFALAQ